MSNSTSSKGGSHLASVLQMRMSDIMKRSTFVSVEIGKIVSGGKLKLSSIPGTILEKSDFYVCASIKNQLQVGIKVLIVWTYDGEPVVVDKVT